MELRPYQIECLDAIWSEINQQQTALVSLSTGSGKSVIIYELIRKSLAAKPDLKCLVLFNRVTLLSQLAARFRGALGDDVVGIYCGTEGEWDLSRPVTVGSIQSLDEKHLDFNLVIVDECHNISEARGRYITLIRQQLAKSPRTRLVGVTATPYRSDGFIYGKGKLFTRTCYERGLRFFINNKFLVPPIAKQPDHLIDLSKLRILKGEYRQDDIDAQTMNVGMAKDQVIDALNRAVGRKKILWCCSSINHAELIKSLLHSMGEQVETLHSKMEWDDRDKAESWFMQGSARHLTFVTVVSEGWDYPAADCMVLMRPTKSPGLMVQVCGRVLRPFPGKEDALILDYAQVVTTLGPLESPVIQKKGKGGKGEIEPIQKTCPECRTLVPPRVASCPECGFNWPKEEAMKLSLVADENVRFMDKTPQRLKIINVKLSHYVSKSDNQCYRLEYIAKGLLSPSLFEYFSYENEWAYRRFQIRAIELQIELKSDPSEQAIAAVQRIPSEVEFVHDGKYQKVRRLIFD